MKGDGAYMFFWKRNNFKSQLFSQNDFYKAFLKDLESSKKEVGPFITASRMEKLYPVFENLLSHGIKVHFVTRDPIDHEDEYIRYQATNEILYSKELGIKITLLRGFHHRKLAIIDRKTLWEGSLNILSYSKSQEIMRRIEDEKTAKHMLNFLRLPCNL